MKPVPGTLQEGGASFQTTHWTLVVSAGQTEPSESAQRALAAFCETYWPPLYAFLRHRRYPPADAQDLVQAFFLYLFEKNALERADREKGRLRTFLLTSLQNFLINEHDRKKAIKRGGDRIILSLDQLLPEAEINILATAHLDDVACYDLTWAAISSHALGKGSARCWKAKENPNGWTNSDRFSLAARRTRQIRRKSQPGSVCQPRRSALGFHACVCAIAMR